MARPAKLTEAPIASLIREPNRHSQKFLEKLAEDISLNGLLHPPYTTPLGDHLKVISGNGRVTAVEQLGWKKVPVFVADDIDHATQVIIGIAANTLNERMAVPDLADKLLELQRLLPSEPTYKLAKRLNVAPAVASQTQSAMAEYSDEEKETLATAKAPMWLYFAARKIPNEHRHRLIIGALEEHWTRERFQQETKHLIPKKTMTVYKFSFEVPRDGGFDGFRKIVKDLLSRMTAFERQAIDFSDAYRLL